MHGFAASSILGKLICYSVVVPFQILKAAANKSASSKLDPLNDVAKFIANRAIIDGLDDQESISF